MNDEATRVYPDQQTAAADALPPWKRRLFLAITVLFPVLALALVEGGLRLFGWGGYPPFITQVGTLPSGETLCVVDADATRPYFFANPDRPGFAEESAFRMPKPANTVRIFLIGESAAKGYPQPRNLAMSSFLARMLEDLTTNSGKAIEVINLGTTAVASFPLVAMTEEAARYEPDYIIFYVGNNEFFGAYGTASINSAGTLPTWALPAMRFMRGLAVVQALDGALSALGTGAPEENRTLMEEMIGQVSIAPDSPLRATAASHLRAHLEAMIREAKAAGATPIVCTTASNESGLAPLGDGADARARFERAQALFAAGDVSGAREAFLEARDLDTMPWRPTRATEQAIRDAAASGGALLCDIAAEFRARDTSGAVGWEFLDDHVHLTVRGQAEAARLMVEAIASAGGALGLDRASLANLPVWDTYARALGTNEFDDYRVHHTMRVLFGISFMKRGNRAAHARFEALCQELEARVSPGVREALLEWQTVRPHAGGMRPLTGMVARVALREGRIAEAARLYEIAKSQVPEYTSWFLEYAYFELAATERLTGSLTESNRAEAARAIEIGRTLLAFGNSESGLTERYVGRLHQLQGEWPEAIPYLEAARPKMSGTDLVACDQALVMSYLNSGRTSDARRLIDQGIAESGQFAPIYRKMAEQFLAPKR
jgi:tetratricopeptide (TPR) repeat protein/nitrate reductase NapE component